METAQIDYIEARVKELVAFKLETMELLNKRAHLLITLQLGSGGALATFAAGLIDKSAPYWLVTGVVAGALMLLVTASVGAQLCLFTEPVLPPGNEPKNLMTLDKELAALRLGELAAVQKRLEQWSDRNARIGAALNGLYIATAAIPLLAIVLAVAVR